MMNQEQWVNLALQYLPETGETCPAFAVRVGEACHSAEQRRKPTSIFHTAASLTGKPCICSKCRPDILF